MATVESNQRSQDRRGGRNAPTSAILDRQPPYDRQAEQAVLGSILIWPDICDEVVMHLQAEDFHDPAHEAIFREMLSLHDSSRKVDVTLLVDALKRSGDFERCGGTAYLGQLSNAVPNASNAVYYAKVVAEKSARRSLISAGTEILRDAYEESDEWSALIGRAEQKIFSILDNRKSSEITGIRDVLHDALTRIDARMKGEHTVGGVDTGFTELDSLLGGLHNTELIVLAARPSMGKTSLAMNIAEFVSIKCKQGVLFISLEMSALELADRMLCSVARVNGHRLRNGTISQQDRQRLVQTAAEISQCPLFIDDSPSRSVTEIAAAARRVRRKADSLGLIVIDYLQLIEPDNPRDPRQEQVARMSRRLKGLAREMDVPVLCLAQLNRQAEESKAGRPKLSHLRESGAIEQDADVVMFVHREDRMADTEEERRALEGEAVVVIGKQRNGPIGEVPLFWHKDFTRFENRETHPHDDFEQFNQGGEFV